MSRLLLLVSTTLALLLGVGLCAPSASGDARTLLQPMVTVQVPEHLTWGDDWTLTVTVTADGVVPTGTVHAAWDGPDGGAGDPVELESGTLVDGTAELTIDGKALPFGGHGLIVTYAGDGSVAPSDPQVTPNPTPTPFIDRASSRRPVLTVTRVPAPRARGTARVVVGAKREDMPTPTGVVIVRMQGVHTVKRVKGALADGVAVVRLPRLHRGPWVLRARYLGDEHYRLRIGDDRTITVS